MSRFLFTMFVVNDLGLPTRLIPIARALADRGHDVAVFNPAPAPTRIIEEAGLIGLPMPSTPPADSEPVPPTMDWAQANAAWDVEEMFAHIFSDVETVRAATALNVDLMRQYSPNVVVDSFGLFACMAARILRIPLVTVNQGNFHPASDGFIWWAGPRPVGLPSPVLAVNKVLSEYGVAPVARSVDLFAGDFSLITGTPETDPVAPSSTIEHVGQILWQRGSASLPDSIADLSTDKPLIWVYAGNPRYFGPSTSTPFDSIVVIRAAIAALADAPVHVVLTMGHQDLPEEFGTLPLNFQLADYLPGLAMARRCDLMINHGGHSSYMTALSAGTPAVIVPTSSERESNARRLAALGAGEFVLPTTTPDGEKQIDVAEFREKIVRVIGDQSYRTSARRIADSMRPYGGAAQAADRIESLVLTKS